MIDVDTAQVQLSDDMKQKIASGAVSVTEDEAKADVLALLKQVVSYVNYDPIVRADLMQKLKQGQFDAQAVVDYQLANWTGHASPKRYQSPLVSQVVMNSGPMPGDEEFIEELIKQTSPNVTTSGGIPLFAFAFWRMSNEHHFFPTAWEVCRQDKRLDLEIPFGIYMDIGMGSGVRNWKEIEGTLLNQCCQYKHEIEMHHGSQYLNQDIVYLLAHGAVLDPRWIDLMEVHGWTHDYRAEWQGLWDKLTQAIAAKDSAVVQRCLADNVVARGFSLGHGAQMCEPSFWGDYWDDGKNAVLALPEWVKRQLAPDIARMLSRQVPDAQLQQWIYDDPLVEPHKPKGI